MIYPQDFETRVEFDAIRRMLKDECLCRLGCERVDAMQFLTDYATIDTLLNEVVEFVRIMQVEDGFPSDFYYDVREPLMRIRIEGMYMTSDELFALRRSLDTIGRILSLLRKQSSDAAETDDKPLYPSLRALAGDVEAFPRIIRDIDSIIDKFGAVKDSASPALARIRGELARTSGSISRTLNSILRRVHL